MNPELEQVHGHYPRHEPQLLLTYFSSRALIGQYQSCDAILSCDWLTDQCVQWSLSSDYPNIYIYNLTCTENTKQYKSVLTVCTVTGFCCVRSPQNENQTLSSNSFVSDTTCSEQLQLFLIFLSSNCKSD